MAIYIIGNPEPPTSALYYAGPELGYLNPTIFAALTPSGNGSGSSRANAIAMSTALANATPGTVIGAAPGVYTKAAFGNKFQPAWQIANNGTAANPIIVVAEHSAIDLAGKAPGARWTTADLATVFANPLRSELRHTGQTNGAGGGTGGPAFGSSFLPTSGRTDHWWIGFCVDEAQAHPCQDSGPVVLWACARGKIMRCVIYGRPAPWDVNTGDNHNGIRCEDYTVGVEASDNVIYGFLSSVGGAGSGHNHCGIQRYAHESTTVGLRLLHNYIFGCHTGVFLKDEPTFASDEIIRYNIFDDNIAGLEIANCNAGSQDSYAEFNLFTAGRSGLNGQQGGGNRIHMRYNTIYVGADGPDVGAGILAHFFGSGCEFNGNVVYGINGNLMYDANFRTFATIVPANYNCYFSPTGFRARFNGGNHTTIASWRASTGQDLNSINTNPLFTDAAGFNFEPQAGSPILTAAQDGGRIGHSRGGVAPGPRYRPT